MKFVKKLTIKTSTLTCQWHCLGVLIDDLKHIPFIILVFPLLTFELADTSWVTMYQKILFNLCKQVSEVFIFSGLCPTLASAFLVTM